MSFKKRPESSLSTSTTEIEEKKPFKCSLCPYKCGRKYDLSRHIATVHEKKKPFQCSLCLYKCVDKGHLNRHISFVHEKKRTFRCSLCTYKCGEQYDLSRPRTTILDGRNSQKYLHQTWADLLTLIISHNLRPTF